MIKVSRFETKQTLAMRAFLASKHAKEDASLLQMMAGQPLNFTPDFIRQPVEEVDYGVDFRPGEVVKKFESDGLVLLDPSFRYLVQGAGRIAISGKTKVDSYIANRKTSGSLITATFGNHYCFSMYTMLALVVASLSKQINGTPGMLSVSGDTNAFYFFDESRFMECFATLTRPLGNGKWEACIQEADDEDEGEWAEDTKIHLLYLSDI